MCPATRTLNVLLDFMWFLYEESELSSRLFNYTSIGHDPYIHTESRADFCLSLLLFPFLRAALPFSLRNTHCNFGFRFLNGLSDCLIMLRSQLHTQ